MMAAVTAAHVNYHAPAKFDDELSLWSRCISMGKVRFRFEYEVWREMDDTLVASGYTEHAMLDHHTLRPVRIPDWVHAGVEHFEASHTTTHPEREPPRRADGQRHEQTSAAPPAASRPARASGSPSS